MVNMMRLAALVCLVLVVSVTDVHGQGFFSGLQSMVHKLNPFRPKHQQSSRPFVQTSQGQSFQQQQFTSFPVKQSQSTQSHQLFQGQNSQQVNRPVTSFIQEPIPSPGFAPNTFFHPRPISLLQSLNRDPSPSGSSFSSNQFSQQTQLSGFIQANRKVVPKSSYCY